MNRTRTALAPVCLVAAIAFAGAATGQSLYQRQAQVPVNEFGEPDPAQPLQGVSMLVQEPEPIPTYERFDLITIVVNESSQQTRGQSMETLRRINDQRTLSAFPDPNRLVQDATLTNVRPDTLNLFGYQENGQLQRESDYERRDRITNRITAQVIDVKPNGNLVLEARTRIQTDEEIQEFVLTGTCRTEDVTRENTVQSSEMFGLEITSEHEGELRQTTRRGWLKRFMDFVNPF